MPISDRFDRIIEIENRSITDFKKRYGDIVIKYIQEVKRKKTTLNNNSLSLSPFGNDFVNALEQLFTMTYLLSRSTTQNIINEQLKFADLSDIDFSKIPYGQAIRIMNSKGIMIRSDYARLTGWMRAYSFSVARIEKLNLILALRESLTLAIAEGLTLDKWQDILPEIFNSHGVTPLRSAHLENVLRTNIATVQNAASYEEYISDENVEGLEHFGINDKRRREDHAALDGVYRLDEFNLSYTIPPHDYMCRCGTAPVIIGQKKTLTGQPLRYKKVRYPGTLPNEFIKTDATIPGAIKRLKQIEREKEQELSKK